MMGEGQGDPMRGFFSWRVHVISREPFTKTKWLLRLTAQLHSSYRSMRKLHIGLLMASLTYTTRTTVFGVEVYCSFGILYFLN